MSEYRYTFAKLLRDWALIIAMLAGISGYLVYMAVPALHPAGPVLKKIIDMLQPLLIFMMLFLLTSSTCHPKIIREQRCDTLMPFHEHGSKDGLLILRQRHLYCHNSPGKLKHLVHTHVYI